MGREEKYGLGVGDLTTKRKMMLGSAVCFLCIDSEFSMTGQCGWWEEMLRKG